MRLKDRLSGFVKAVGLPRIIIFAFFLLVVFGAHYYGLGMPALFGSVLRRWGMFGVLVLAMVPAIQCGIGPNFGVSLGIVCGLLGSLIVIEFKIAEMLGAWGAITIAMLLSIVFAIFVGAGYGFLLNRVKGSEMTVSTYVGFSAIAFMNIWWVTLPFRSGEINWPIGGEGARNTISLASSFGEVLNTAGGFYAIGDDSAGMYVPTGLLLFFFAMCYVMYLFMKSKTGKAMSAAGSNPVFARASGINVDRMRIVGTAISTVLGAVGIITYAQAFGFLQMYNAALMMGFACVAAILIGGASTVQARISNVVIGTFLFQGILVIALPVANKLFVGTDLSDIMRIIISNGIIIYAITRSKGGAASEE